MTTITPTRITMSYREAVKQAIRDAITSDDRVFLMGEDVGAYGGCYACTKGLFEELGPDKIRDTPLSESVFVGAGIGGTSATPCGQPSAVRKSPRRSTISSVSKSPETAKMKRDGL